MPAPQGRQNPRADQAVPFSPITDATNKTTTYEYDARGNRTAVVDPMNNRTTFDYDPGSSRLTKITYQDTTTTQFG